MLDPVLVSLQETHEHTAVSLANDHKDSSGSRAFMVLEETVRTGNIHSEEENTQEGILSVNI